MSQGQDATQNIQALSQQLQELDEVQGQLQEQLEAALTRQHEVSAAIESLEAIETDSRVQVPLGGDAYVKADIVDIDEVIVKIGSDYAAEQSRDDAISILEERSDRIGEQINELRESLDQVDANIQQAESQAQQLREQMIMQQAEQQLGGMGMGGEDI